MENNFKQPMNQLYLKFPIKKNYLKQDFYVSSNNLEAHKLLDSFPNWPDKRINIYGPLGCGKTHLANILKEKINALIVDTQNIDEKILELSLSHDCLIIDNFKNNLKEEFFYTLLNHLDQHNKYIIVNSQDPIQSFKIKLKDLKSRLNSFIVIGIDLPSENLLRVIISKSFSDKQIELNNRNLEYIIKNIDRSYTKISKFISDVDNESLSSGKMINIKLIKKILSNE